MNDDHSPPASLLLATLTATSAPSRSHHVVHSRLSAEGLVRLGADLAPLSAPVEALGRWRSVDVAEIRGVRSVLAAVRQYLRSGPKATPVGIALFGPPGCGKSFVLQQIAAELAEQLEFVEFNLSQMPSHERLTECFHRVQGIGLRGRVPLVLWDEFDTPLATERLGWLRHFLAPLQDGLFGRAGELLPTGPGIYAFVGGASRSYAEFSAPAPDEATYEHEKAVKKPDFVSRLAAFMDVMGPNPTKECISDGRYCLRRALRVRQTWERLEPGRGTLPMQPGLLHALLMVGRYRNGSRSLDAIVQSAHAAGRDYLDVSSLPPTPQLDLHVKADEFLELARRDDWCHVLVGAFGHRDVSAWPEAEIRGRIRQLLTLVGARGTEPRQPPVRPNHGIFVTVFCTLARGVDRLVAEVASELAGDWRDESAGTTAPTRGIRLMAVLPREVKAYRHDRLPGESDEDVEGHMRQLSRWLSRASGVIELYRPPADEEGYESLADFLRQHCDLVISATSAAHPTGQGRTLLNHVLREGSEAIRWPSELVTKEVVHPAGDRARGMGDLEIALHKVVRNAPTSS